MRYENSKILFYFDQYFVIRLGEKIYHYNPKIERYSTFRAIITLVIYCFKNLRFKNESVQKKDFKRLVYIETINQKNALIDIFSKIDNKEESLFILHDINGKLDIADYKRKHFPKHKLYRNALLHFPKALRISRKYINKNKSIINKSHVLINLSLFISSVKIFEKELKRFGIRQVVLSNDHNLQPLSLLLAAKNLNVPSYYIQHASVSPAFPKLLPDYSLLEGQQALDVYNKIGNLSKKNYLVGIPRLDGLLNYKNSIDDNITVGFCIKPHYSLAVIKEYINTFKTCKNVGKIILRPHPGDDNRFYEQLKAFNVEISNAKMQRPHEFLKKLNVLISGESSIVLESALMKVKTIYIDDNVAQYDLYGFVKNKIAIPVASFEDLRNELQQVNFSIVEENYNHCSYYCSTINTNFENKSKELIINILQDA